MKSCHNSINHLMDLTRLYKSKRYLNNNDQPLLAERELLFRYIVLDKYGRFPKCHRVFVGPRPWHIEILHRVKKTSTFNLLEISKIEIMETDRSIVPEMLRYPKFQKCCFHRCQHWIPQHRIPLQTTDGGSPKFQKCCSKVSIADLYIKGTANNSRNRAPSAHE